MTTWARRRGIAVAMSAFVGALLVMSGIAGIARAGTGASVSYSVETGAYNNTVRLGPNGILSSPRVVTGPDPTNPSQEDVYVLGLNDTGIGTCSNITVFRSTDGGVTFHGEFPAGICLPGAALDAVVLADGTLLAAAAGPQVLSSTDGGVHWSTPLSLGGSTSIPALYRDPASGELYLTWSGSAGNSSGGLFLATSTDGGLSWGTPAPILPSGITSEQPEVAAHGSSVAVAFLELSYVRLPSPPPSGNNTTRNPPPEAPVEALAAVTSTDGGASWRSPTVIVPENLSLLVGEPSLAVSSSGTFAIAWSQVNATSSQNGTFVSFSSGGGTPWSTPTDVSPQGPPVVAPTTFGHTDVFDSAGRLLVTWHNYSTRNPLAAQLNVAISNRSLDSFTTSSFALAFETPAGNGTQSENLANDSAGRVFLAWDVFGPWNDPRFGVFVRTVSGEAVGSVSGLTGSATVELRDATSGATVGKATWSGQPFTLAGIVPDVYQVWVTTGNGSTLAGTIPIVPWASTSFVVEGTSLAGPTASSPYVFVILGAAVVVAGVSVGVSYTRLTRDTVLRQKLRSLIFEYIQSEPGSSFNAIRDALGLQNGTTAYHLGVLEREGFVQSVVRSRRRHFFPVGGAQTSCEPPLSGIQSSILKAVGSTPGIGLRELSRTIGREPSSVAYSTRVLTREGHLRTVRTGFRLQYFPGTHPGPAGLGPEGIGSAG